MRHGSGIDPDNIWLKLANYKDEEVVTSSTTSAASAPEPAATNGTPIAGFTAPG